MARCLVDAGIPAGVSGEGTKDGGLMVAVESDKPWSMSFGGQTSGTVGMDPEDPGAVDRLSELVAERVAQDQAGGGLLPFLIVGEEDLTEPFRACLAESGYTEPEFGTEPAAELREKQDSLESTMAWIECARANGYPDLADPRLPVADEFRTWPSALLPVAMTEAQLLELLRACPIYDAAAHEAAEAYRQEHYDENWTRTEELRLDAEIRELFPLATIPRIGFDSPGFGGGEAGGIYTWQDSPDAAHLEVLQRILWDTEDDYYRDDWIVIPGP
jgi:hypothetical protein